MNRLLLKDMHQNIHGGTVDKETSDMDLIMQILEVLIDKVIELDGHSHTIS